METRTLFRDSMTRSRPPSLSPGEENLTVVRNTHPTNSLGIEDHKKRTEKPDVYSSRLLSLEFSLWFSLWVIRTGRLGHWLSHSTPTHLFLSGTEELTWTVLKSETLNHNLHYSLRPPDEEDHSMAYGTNPWLPLSSKQKNRHQYVFTRSQFDLTVCPPYLIQYQVHGVGEWQVWL